MPFLGSCTIGGGGVGYTVNANGLKEEMIRKANLAGFPSGPSQSTTFYVARHGGFIQPGAG